ncbi:MAG: hypothetical protein ACLSA6_01830 [Holdemania massiliensis]
MSSLEMRVYSLVDLVIHLKRKQERMRIVRSVDEIIEYLYDPKTRQCTQRPLPCPNRPAIVVRLTCSGA